MVEYERLFAESVQKKLKNKIIGRIFVCVTHNDELLVKIYRDEDVMFQSLEPHFTKNLQNGLTSNEVVRNTVKQFRETIHKKIDNEWFYQNERPSFRAI